MKNIYAVYGPLGTRVAMIVAKNKKSAERRALKGRKRNSHFVEMVCREGHTPHD